MKYHASAVFLVATITFSAVANAAEFSGFGGSLTDTQAVQRDLDGGKTVDLPRGDFFPARPLFLKTPGQLIHGAGRNATRIHVRPGFAGDGVFTAVTNMSMGPVFRDFLVLFEQPDTGDFGQLIRYPPAFNLVSVPRFEMAHVGCFEAMVCVDMTNSSGASIYDLQFSAFDRGIIIDNALDTTRIIDPHWFPFNIKPKQQALFASQGAHRPVGISIGRADDFVLRGGLFLGGVGIKISASEHGSAFGTIDGTDFDTLSGIEMSGGSFRLNSCIFTVGETNSTALSIRGGVITLSSSSFYSDRDLKNPLVSISGRPGVSTTSVSMAAVVFDTGATDTQAIEQNGGVMTLTGAQFSKTPGKSFEKPVISLKGGRTLMSIPYITDKGAGYGVFIDIQNDNPANRIIGAVALGWANRLPAQPAGQYVLR